MKITIVENELYLAQSISSKLTEQGYDAETFSSIKEAMKSNADVFLLSTNIPGQNIMPLIEKFKDKIIILMVNYINNDTVGEPLKRGAKDYIVKPFMIEELLRKIEHYQEYQELKKENNLYKEYIYNMLGQIKVDFDIDKLSSCTVIETNYPKAIDKLIFEYAKKHKKHLSIISVQNENWQDKITKFNNELLYIIDVHTLKKADKEQLLTLIQDKEFIICTTTTLECDFDTITITTESKLYDHNEILTIDDYVKYVVNNFQYKFPDTELSKKLGISRKSLWEKRKKYGLFKKK
jgi:response regulator of citrate/malate metabolism